MRNAATLFAPLHRELIALLESLSAEAWNAPTVAGQWRVRDVAAHLLDGDLRKLAMCRDGHFSSAPASPGYKDLVDLINSLNATGVAYGARLSPRLLIDLLAVTGKWVTEFIEQLDPDGLAVFSVAWAGENESKNWMDTGREYTERWHHQMHIRDAVGAPLLLDDYWFKPLLDFSLKAITQTTTAIDIVIDDLHWRIGSGAAAASLSMTRDQAWRWLYNAPVEGIRIDGDAQLAERVLRARSVMV